MVSGNGNGWLWKMKKKWTVRERRHDTTETLFVIDDVLNNSLTVLPSTWGEPDCSNKINAEETRTLSIFFIFQGFFARYNNI
jgi:hypothetical protein